MAAKRDDRVKVSALLCAGHKVCEVANLVRVSRTAVYAIEKRNDDGEVTQDCLGYKKCLM